MNGSFKDIFDPTSRPEPRRASASLLAPLLVVALFVCHGAMGGADHQTGLELMPSASAGALQTAGGSADAHSADSPVDSSVDQPASHVDYVVAALFAGLCASLLVRLFGVSRTGAFTASCAVRRVALGVPSLSVLPARPPTAPEVQVFRL